MTKRSKIIWTDEMDNYILKNYHVKSFEEMANKLGLNYDSVKSRCRKIIPPLHRQRKGWSEMELDLLYKHVSSMRIEELARMLKRTTNAVILKLYELEGSCDISIIKGYMRTPDISAIMGVDKSTVNNWVNKGELKAIKTRAYLHYEEEYFWKWLKKNLHKVNLKNVEPYILMTSPDWYANYVKEKQREMYANPFIYKRFTSYSPVENAYLLSEKAKGRPLRDIAKELNRSYESVRNQVAKLNRMKNKRVI